MKKLIFLITITTLFSCQKEDIEPRNPVSDEVMEKAKEASKALHLKDYETANKLLKEAGPTEEEKKVVDNLIEKYGEANILLWTTAQSGDLLTIKDAINKGANPNFEIDGHGGVLLGVTNSGVIESVKYLLEKGADPNTQNLSGATPMSVSVANGRLDLVKLLLKHKASFNRGGDPSTKKFSVLSVALTTRKMEMFDYLLKAGADPNGANGLPLAFSVMLKNKRAIKSLVEKGADINFSGKDGFRPLMTAVVEGDEEVIELLLSLGADPKLKDDNGKDAFDWAKKHNSQGGEVLKKLLVKRSKNKK